jgi:hypothetical protein
MARLAEIDTTASKALRFTILTASRTSEVDKMTFDEVDFDKAVWRIPASRMKMQKPHDVPLSDPALAILKTQHEAHDRNPRVFPCARPRQPLSHMTRAMLLRRLGTVHDMRSAARSWMADQAIAFELVEACLAHQVGNAVVQANQRSSMLERRRPIISAWANYVTGSNADNDRASLGGAGVMVCAIVIIIALTAVAPASAQTLTCSTTFQGYRACQGPHGYRSFETQSQGMTIGDDNRGNRWSTSHSQGLRRRRSGRVRSGDAHGPYRHHAAGVRGDCADAAVRQRQLREQDRRGGAAPS